CRISCHRVVVHVMIQLRDLTVFFTCCSAYTSEIYTLSLHDALPILASLCCDARLLPPRDGHGWRILGDTTEGALLTVAAKAGLEDRKSTRLNSSHVEISYAVFCLKKKTG